MPWMTRGLQVLDGAELVAAVIKRPGQRCMDMPGAADDPVSSYSSSRVYSRVPGYSGEPWSWRSLSTSVMN